MQDVTRAFRDALGHVMVIKEDLIFEADAKGGSNKPADSAGAHVAPAGAHDDGDADVDRRLRVLLPVMEARPLLTDLIQDLKVRLVLAALKASLDWNVCSVSE